MHSAHVEEHCGDKRRRNVERVIDLLAEATSIAQEEPAGSKRVEVSHLVEESKAGDAVVARQFERVSIAVDVPNSGESDEVCNGGSVSTLADGVLKSTSVRVGVARPADVVKMLLRMEGEKQQENAR